VSRGLAALTGRETIVVTGMHPTERRLQVRLIHHKSP
jgi:hypothetical protein